jgi:hypothetical protein
MSCVSLGRIFLLLAALFVFQGHYLRPAYGQGGCAVGSKVRIEMMENDVGTITEIVYPWNVRSGNTQGEWYNPKLRDIHVEGSNAKCTTPGTAAGPVRPPGPRQDAGNTAAAPEDGSCPMTAPPGSVTRRSPATAATFKRVIYDDMAAKVNDRAISAPKQIGLTFLEFQMGGAYKNTLSANRIGDRRLHDGAPVGAMIYPVKTKYIRCELYDREISRYVRQTNYACFKNSQGEWDCPVDSTTKTLERSTIPLR